MRERNKKIQDAMIERNIAGNAPISHGVGRRKSSVARVWVRHGKGTIMINSKDFDVYCSTDVARRSVIEPLALVNAGVQFNIDVNVRGGGVHSQAGAIRLAIARALSLYDVNYKKELRDKGYLTVDSRLKERKKYGQKGARRKFQFVKR